MLDTEIKTEDSKEANGISTQVELKPVPIKPWIEAGFKNRAEWRKSKNGGMTAKGEKSEGDVKPKKVKTKKAAAKSAVKAKSAAKAKPVKKAAKKPATTVKAKTKGEDSKKSPLERRAAAMRTDKFKKSLSKREEPNADEQKVMSVFRKGTEKTLREIADVAFPSSNKFDRYLRVKNAFRWFRATKRVKAVTIKRGDEKLGGYERIA
jgi:hypothetical protein